MSKFYIKSEYAELLDLAMSLQDSGSEIVFSSNKEYSKIGEGIVKKDDKWWNYLEKDYIWLVDGCSDGNFQDYLRSKGEYVFGGCEEGDKLENDRQIGQKLFKQAGFYQPISKNFKNIDDALKFIMENRDRRWILKQNADAPKSINHMGKFDNNVDMVFHLQTLKKRWNDSQFGQFDCDLMEVVEGLEVAASAFFNGQDYIRNKDGKVIGFLNFEEKKEADGNTGETTGEMGTTFIGCTEDNKLFKDIILKPKIIEALQAINFRGVFDINCIKTEQGIVALEPTCRFGIPSTSYEFIEGMESPVAELLEIVAKGENKTAEIKMGIGMVMCVVAKPYPVEADLESEATSQGERLWILKNGKPIKDFTEEQKKHIHLQNFYKEDGGYFVATKNGYLLVVSGKGETIESTREALIEYIKNNLYISGMKYRTDIGVRVEENTKTTPKEKLKKKETEMEILKAEKERLFTLKEELLIEHKSELGKKDAYIKKLKRAVKNAVYENEQS